MTGPISSRDVSNTTQPAHVPVTGDLLSGIEDLPEVSTIGTIGIKGEYKISFEEGGVKFDVPRVTVEQKGSPPSFTTDASRQKLGNEFSKVVKEAAKKTDFPLTWDWDEYKKKMAEGVKDVAGALPKKTAATEDWVIIREAEDKAIHRFMMKYEKDKPLVFLHDDKDITEAVLKDLKEHIPEDKETLGKHETKRAVRNAFEKWVNGKFPDLKQQTQSAESDLLADKRARDEEAARLRPGQALPKTRVVSQVPDTTKADELTAPEALRNPGIPQVSQIVQKAAPTSRIAKVSALTKLGRGLALAFGTLLTAVGGALAVTFTAIVVACKAIGQAIGATFGSIADAIAKKGDHKWRDKVGKAFSKPLGAIGTLAVAISLSASLGITELGNALLMKGGNSKTAEAMKRFRKFVMDFTVTAVAESKYATDIPKVYNEYKDRKPKTT